MKLKIEIDNNLLKSEDLKMFIKEFEKQIKTGVTAGEFKSEFLNFKWRVE